jgi:hypothetical protein
MFHSRKIDYYPKKTSVDQTFPENCPQVFNFDEITAIATPDTLVSFH